MNQTFLTPSYMRNRHVGLKVEGSNFTLGGFPFLIVAGTIHYFRVPREYWRDSLLKLKACGFNTVTTHVPWNLHEPKRSQFYFTGNLDLKAFLFMASEVGLWVILCPGPYIGSDLDLGGLPSWLLQDPKMKLRTTYKGFTKAVNHYFDVLIPRIVPLQYKKGGPVIAVQVENEYGSYHLDKRYMSYIKKVLVTRGVEVLLMTADDGQELIRGHLKKVIATVHMRNIKKETYQKLSSVQPIRSAKPICMEKLSVNQGSGQSYGYILYETVITTGGLLTSRGHVKDRGQVFLEEKYIGVLDHSTNQLTIPRKNGHKDYLTLTILVENQGRLAYGQEINKERKGLTGDIYLNNSPLRKFKIYSLEMNTKFLERALRNIWKPVLYQLRGPAFFLGILRIGNYPKDTFIKLEGWTKGVIFINGQNLGRYWNIGPQETLYLPGPWLRPGSNEIIVFEEFKPGIEIQFTNMSHLGDNPASVRLMPTNCPIRCLSFSP
ncbi:PREDICTED: beta-galactosidase-1-like protein 2 [Ceratotherium simum simum]|uniref:Beta-galactosidase-1-like protein 2 n=1 Tax=Ceratotherium simum simum TaxID=73337 RepID=A0ABM1DBI3_CERSS|nr:PREDICTED: beta-galactosidase-1-like protein 2 [Ceratotherium simum simum]